MTKLDLTLEDLNALKEGSLVSIACPSCESHEEHKKVGNVWICQYCGN